MSAKIIITFAVLILGLASPFRAWAGGAKTVWVNAYTKKDGTYVSGHFRSPPDGTGAGWGGPEFTGGYYGTGSSVGPAEKKDVYRYTINVFEDGRELRCAGHFNDLKYSYVEAEESEVWSVQECLRVLFYSRGLDHEGVAALLAAVFSKESCKLETSAPMPNGSIVVHASTMTCLVVGKKLVEQHSSPPSGRFPITCQALQDQSKLSTRCASSKDVVTLYHAGQQVFVMAEDLGLDLTVTQLPDGSLVASSGHGSAQVRLSPPARKK